MTRLKLTILAGVTWLALAGTTFALDETFWVTGPDLAGHARVTATEVDMDFAEGGIVTEVVVSVDVTFTYERFGKDANARTVQGTGTLQDGVLEWTYEIMAPPGKAEGWSNLLGKWSDGTFGGSWTQSWQDRAESRTVRLTQVEGDSIRFEEAETDETHPWGVLTVWKPAQDTSDVTVLLIPGLSTGAWEQLKLPVLKTYFEENLAAVQARGLEAKIVPVQTESGVAHNAGIIAQAVRDEAARGRRVILMPHSKGAADTWAALVLNREIVPTVVGVVAIQPVIGGSHVADWIAERNGLVNATKHIFEALFGGSEQAVTNLTHAERRGFTRDPEHAWPEGLPTVVVTSTMRRRAMEKHVDTGLPVMSSILTPFERLVSKHHGPNDGLVRPEDMRIPGATVLPLEDLDHFESGLRWVSKETPSKITNQGLDTLFDLLAEREEVQRARQSIQHVPRFDGGGPLGEERPLHEKMLILPDGTVIRDE